MIILFVPFSAASDSIIVFHRNFLRLLTSFAERLSLYFGDGISEKFSRLCRKDFHSQGIFNLMFEKSKEK
jgi:hypothetical protein